jgi:hypothetical protein
MTVTVTTVSVMVLVAMVAVPLVCVGLALQWAPLRNHVPRITGAAMTVSGWLVFGVGEAAQHAWWVVPIDAVLVIAGIARVKREHDAAGRGQP